MRTPVMVSVDYTLDFFTVAAWHKRVGDRVEKGDLLLSYETQKESVDVSAEAMGVLAATVVSAGEQVFRPAEITHGAWSKEVGYIEFDGSGEETAPGEEPPQGQPAEKVLPEEVPAATEQKLLEPAGKAKERFRIRVRPDGAVERIPLLEGFPPLPSVAPAGGVRASGRVRALAREKGVELASVQGSGPDGTITCSDIEHTGEKSPGEAISVSPHDSDDFEIRPLTARRRGIAANLEKSWREIPHAGTSIVVDCTRIATVREEIVSSGRWHLGDPDRARARGRWDPFILRAMVRAITEKWQIVNATFTWEGIKLHRHINIGISLADTHGLIVPVIRHAETMQWEDVAYALDGLYRGVRENTLSAKDYRGATVTFNNPGALGGYDGASIIPYDSGSAIVSFHSIGTDGRSILGIRFDHRTFDGFEAVGFLKDVKRILEQWDESGGDL